jgi:hypothetical protein
MDDFSTQADNAKSGQATLYMDQLGMTWKYLSWYVLQSGM